MNRGRYKLVSWDHQKNQGLATDGSAYEGEPILFTVRGSDLDPTYNGVLNPDEVFTAVESPNFLLFDVLVESGPRGLVSQENYEQRERKAIQYEVASGQEAHIMLQEARDDSYAFGGLESLRNHVLHLEDLLTKTARDVYVMDLFLSSTYPSSYSDMKKLMETVLQDPSVAASEPTQQELFGVKEKS